MGLMAFHGSQEIKDKYLALVKMHMDADELVRGVGYEPADGSGKGKMCAIGCTLEAYNHALYETELGIPEWLAHLEDRLFENMSEQKSRTWPHAFLSVIKPGADLDATKGPFLIIVLRSALETFDHQEFPAIKAAIEGSVTLWQRDDIGSEDWAAASAAASDAASAAASDAASDAAWAATRAATWAATWAAASAATWAATWAAASAAKYDYFADELLKLLSVAE